MNKLKILLVVCILAIAAVFAVALLVAPRLDKKITAELNEKYPDYSFEIEKLRWSLIPSSLRLNHIIITSKANPHSAKYLKGEIESIRFKGMKLIKALFKNEYEIRVVVVSGIHLEGNVPFQDNEKIPSISTLNIQIGTLLFDHVQLALKDSSSAQTLTIQEGALQINDLKIKKLDTLGIFNRFDFKAEYLTSVSADSLYTFQVSGIDYEDTIKTLSIEAFSILPNFKGYDFTARFPYETDRIEARFTHLKLYNFPAADYYNHKTLVTSYLSVGNTEVDVFRDKRKENSTRKNPMFQQYFYNYPGFLRIDSIGFEDGKIVYTEHAEKATEPGRVTLNQLKARIYHVTNDTLYKTQKETLEMKAEALLMGKSSMNILLKAKLFDPMNTFYMSGTLAPMEVKELNPILEKNAFLFANAAKIDKVSFQFTANDTKATGEMILLYNGLDIAVKSRKTNDTTGLKERFISFIANSGTWDSNPLPSKEVRVGIIDYERDPTRFVFNYCVKAILSGVKSSIIKHPKRQKSYIQKIFTGEFDKQKNTIRN